MKILTISNYYPSHLGGIEIVAQNLVSRWRVNHQVHWIACEVASHPYKHDLDDIPLPANNLAEERLGFPYPIPSRKSILEIFRQVEWCDIVHIHDCLYFANQVAFIASRWHRKPLIVTQHAALASYSETYKRTLQRLAYCTIGRIVLQNAEQVVFISSRVKNWFESWMQFKRQPTFIPNGVDRNLFYPPTTEERRAIRSQLQLDNEEPVLLFVGRFMQNKGINLIHEIARARPNYHWLILGSGEINPHKWNLPNVDIISFRPQSQLRAYYIAADMFVLPSVGEGFPLSVQEALSCGVPTAVSEETASALRDAPLISLDTSSISKTLMKLDNALERPDFLNALSIKSKTYAERWDWNAIVHKYEENFTNLINMHPTPKANI